MRLFLLFFTCVLFVGCGSNATPPPAITVATTPPANPVENPDYTKWAKAKVGTVLVHQTTTSTEGVKEKTTSTTTTRVKEITDTQIVITTETSMVRYDGFRTDDLPETVKIPRIISLPQGVNKDTFGKVKADKMEKLTVCGKDVGCSVVKTKDRNEAGEALGEIWTSDAVPGGLVKSIRVVGAIKKTTLIELVKWE